MRTSWQEQWLDAIAPDEPHKLDRRLAWDGLSEPELEQWLKSDVSADEGAEASWQQALQDCCVVLQRSWQHPLLNEGPAHGQRAFVDLWWPIRCHGAERLEQKLAAWPGIEAVDASVYGQLADSLLERLCSIAEQALWETFSADRSPGKMLLAHLGASGDGCGPPMREHYEAFIQRHRRDGLNALLSEFPALGRFIGTVFVLWLQSSIDMLQRVCGDRSVLEKVFAIPSGQALQVVKQGLSDPHRGGRAVAILSFAVADMAAAAEESMQVVYKPKDMGVDAAYQAVLKELNAKSDLPPLQTLAIHTGHGYGYMEYVPHRLCTNDEELQRFYCNAGRLTALLHLLGCTDCHYENLIACGDQLLLIDTETLLEAVVHDHVSNSSAQALEEGPSGLQKRFQGSVLRSGLLPQWMFLGAAKMALDISALGMAPPEKDEQPSPGWLGLNSDGMMPGRVSRPAVIPTSLPVGVGAANPFNRFLEPFCDGFRSQSQVLIARRESWLAADGVLAHFAGLPRRIVLRATRVYFTIQRQQLEAASLRSSLAQALKLEQLARSFLLAEAKPLHWPVFAAELQQMQQLDIPFFTHSIDGDGLHLDESERELPGFIQTSGLASARERLRQLDSEEVEFQIRLIRGAAEARQLRSTTTESAAVDVESADQHRKPSTQAGAGQEAALRISQRLMDLAIRDPKGQVEWLGMDLGADGESFAFGPVGLSLYGGAIGIACLLDCLQKQHGPIDDFRDLQTAILQPLHQLADQAFADNRLRWWRDQPLGLSGCGGILLGLEQLGQGALIDALLDAALPRLIDADQQLDMIGGCAGVIGPLLRSGRASAQQLAIVAGDHLLAQQTDAGCWRATPRQPGLLGFSHGSAGYAAALARLYTATGEERFRVAAVAALEYERSLFSQDNGNWPDMRNPNQNIDSPTFMSTWCHGAPGIGLGRACLWGTELWDETCVKEMAIALKTTASVSSHAADHLCCGSLGLMVLLQSLASGPWPIDGALKSRCIEIADDYRLQALLRCQGDTVDLRCFGTREGTLLLPGFFTGLSGMGLALMDDQATEIVVRRLISGGLFPDQ
ncbi:MAG: type 2 lanthipeptide synthetase LanM family protein [Prochlorococcus sp.]